MVWHGNCPYTGRVIVLAIDTSSPTSSVAVLRDAELLGVISTRTDEDHSSRIFRQIELLLRELSLKLNEFDVFAVSTGPGTFTGLRVGLTAVKGWAEAYAKPIAAISGLEALASQCQSRSARTVVPVVDARRAQVYFGRYVREGSASPKLRLEGAEQVAPPELFFEELGKQANPAALVIVTPHPALVSSLQQKFRELRPSTPEFAIEEAPGVLAPYIGRLAYGRAQEGRLLDSLQLDANYIRRADAEVAAKV
jgi:tRNA threonylcarbamoyladenosine biosynthesis protein TsaB